MAGFNPLGDRVLLKRVEAEEKTPGGLFIPATAKEKPTEALVIAVGPGRTLDNGTRVPVSVKQGDRVVLGRYSGLEVKLEGVEHVVVSEQEILGVAT